MRWSRAPSPGVPGLRPPPEHPRRAAAGIHFFLAPWWPAGHILGYEHGFSHQVVDLVNAIAAGEQPRPSFDDGLHVQRVLDAVEQSSLSGSAWTPTSA